MQDKLRMEMLAKDDLYIEVKDLHDNLHQMSILPSNFEGKEKVGKWLRTLNEMEVGDNLTEVQAREMVHDLEVSHNAFNACLQNS